MSSKGTRLTIATIAQPNCALSTSRKQRPEQLLLKVHGRLVGGARRGRPSNAFDPAMQSRAHSLAHGMKPIAAVRAGDVNRLAHSQSEYRAEAYGPAAIRAFATAPAVRRWQVVLKIGCSIRTGALPRLLNGSGAHIALNALTPTDIFLLA